MSSIDNINSSYKKEEIINLLKQKPKIKVKKISMNKLNTVDIFRIEYNNKNKFTKINNTKTIDINNNSKSKKIFKNIDLKSEKHLISNPKAFSKFRISQLIKSEIKINNKIIIPMSEPNKNINNKKISALKKISNSKKNNNKLNLINQPKTPMTIEMENFKKMRMREKIITEKKLGEKINTGCSQKIPRAKTIIKLTNNKNNNILDDNYKKDDEDINNNTYNLYMKNIGHKNSDINKNVINTFSSINTDSINTNIKLETDNNNLISVRTKNKCVGEKISNINIDYNSNSLRERASEIKIEKEILRKELKVNSKNPNKKIKLSEITEKKRTLDNNNTIPNKRRAIKIIKRISYTKDKKNESDISKKKIDSNCGIKNIQSNDNIKKNKTEDIMIIKKKLEKFLDIIYSNKKSKIEYCFNILKEFIINKNNNNKNQILNISLINKNKIKKEAFDYFYQLYNKLILSNKKIFISKIKYSANNNKKLESIKNIIKIINNKYISNIKLFIILLLRKYISEKNKIKFTKKLITFFSKYIISLKSLVYFQIKLFDKSRKKLRAINIIKNYFTKKILQKKKNLFFNFKQYLKNSKQKESVEIINKILSKKIITNKKMIFNKILLYNNIIKKFADFKKFKNYIIKNIIKKLVYTFKSLNNCNNKLKSVEYLNKSLKKIDDIAIKNSFNYIKKFALIKKILEGIDRFKDFFIPKKLIKLRIYFEEFINNIKKLRIIQANKKFDIILKIQKAKIRKDIFFILKQNYKRKIKVIKFLLKLETIINTALKEYKKDISKIIKNIIINKIKIQEKKNKILIDTTNSFILGKNNIKNINKIKKEENISINISKNKEKDKLLNKNNIEENSDDNEIWTTCIEKWGVIYNSDDSLYEKNIGE